MGKVPILKVDGAVIFESAVINEYLDETNPPSMHPTDPLQRALNRSWVEYATGLIVAVMAMYSAEDEADYKRAFKTCVEKLTILDSQIQHAPYFNGETFALIDAAYAPIFMRLDLMNRRHPLELEKTAPKAWAWGQEMLKRESVVKSVVPDFTEVFYEYIEEGGGYAAQLFE